eukprot:151782-Rhodomonas_salina.1
MCFRACIYAGVFCGMPGVPGDGGGGGGGGDGFAGGGERYDELSGGPYDTVVSSGFNNTIPQDVISELCMVYSGLCDVCEG